MFRKLRSFLGSSGGSDSKDDSLDLSLYHEVPEDEKFVANFTERGGFFFHYEFFREAFDFIKEFESVNEVEKFFTLNPTFIKNLNKDFDFTRNPTETDFALITCEHLIVFDGSIMVSSNQTGEYKSHHLPKNILILANPNQITRNVSTALEKIKSKYDTTQYPTNITSLRPKDFMLEEQNPSAKNLYLLLVENLNEQL